MLDDRTRLDFPPSGVADIPLRFSPQVLRCSAAGPGGRPLTVLIDTGTDPSAIDLGLARRLGLRIGDFALGSDATSDGVPFTETVLPWLRLGELCLRDLYALAVDLRHAPFEVDVVLGYNVLSNLSLDILYAERRLRLYHPDLAPPDPGETGAVLPLHFFDHFPALANASLLAPAGDPAALRHCLELPLLTIDTGSNGALTLSADLADLAGLSHDSASGEGHSFASGCAVRRGMAAGLRIGPFEVRDVALDAPEGGHGDLGRAGRANLGNGVLARFNRVALDYRRALCVLEPGRIGQAGVFVWQRQGLVRSS
ncbi:MAG: retropepsin-like aspartic protease [Oscillochloridaceae bacterium]|nr:aspartyl protease family protein [Chloroflexaceae bacterium]MDW8391268.1 retropepsin-like aspartic protease [Oscillochloridaceae bacterium]